MRIFVAGATGVVGHKLVPLLVRAGHEVTGMTRSIDKAAALERAGARPIVMDVFDGPALLEVVRTARPDAVIHQLTDLPDVIGAEGLGPAGERNARIRIDGTRNLVAAARAAGARRLVAQSIAWVYAPGPAPHAEADPLLQVADSDPQARTLRGVRALEEMTLGAPGIDGIVLRYGRFYGPGTWSETRTAPPALHVDAAAQAAVLALTRGEAGVYNIAEDDGAVSIAKARAQLGFDPDFRLAVAA